MYCYYWQDASHCKKSDFIKEITLHYRQHISETTTDAIQRLTADFSRSTGKLPFYQQLVLHGSHTTHLNDVLRNLAFGHKSHQIQLTHAVIQLQLARPFA